MSKTLSVNIQWTLLASIVLSFVILLGVMLASGWMLFSIQQQYTQGQQGVSPQQKALQQALESFSTTNFELESQGAN